MKVVSEILNYREIMFVIASASLSAVKYVNSFARCQHLFDIATKHRLTSIRIFCRTLLPCLSYILRLKCYHLICRWQTGSNYLPQISSKHVQYSCEAKEIANSRDTTTYIGTEGRRDRQSEKILPSLRRQKNYYG